MKVAQLLRVHDALEYDIAVGCEGLLKQCAAGAAHRVNRRYGLERAVHDFCLCFRVGFGTNRFGLELAKQAMRQRTKAD